MTKLQIRFYIMVLGALASLLWQQRNRTICGMPMYDGITSMLEENKELIREFKEYL